MPIREMHFSEARRKLSTIVDQVERSGQPIKILRHGKPVALLVNPEDYQLRSRKKRNWQVAGSLRFRKGVDVDKVLADGRREFRKALDARQQRTLRELNEP